MRARHLDASWYHHFPLSHPHIMPCYQALVSAHLDSTQPTAHKARSKQQWRSSGEEISDDAIYTGVSFCLVCVLHNLHMIIQNPICCLNIHFSMSCTNEQICYTTFRVKKKNQDTWYYIWGAETQKDLVHLGGSAGNSEKNI